jgi:hypothetical protein
VRESRVQRASKWIQNCGNSCPETFESCFEVHFLRAPDYFVSVVTHSTAQRSLHLLKLLNDVEIRDATR